MKKIFWWALLLLLMATPRFHSLLGEILGGKAYRERTLSFLAQNKAEINRWATRDSIPPIALAGAVGGEFNAGLGTRAVIDFVQDNILLPYLPEWMLTLDRSKNWRAKWLNIAEHDAGVGNIRIATALEITQKYRSEFPVEWSEKEAVIYLLSTEGNIRMASLCIKEAKKVLDPYLGQYSETDKEALYITYYFQGEAFAEKCRIAFEQKQTINPGEGQRARDYRAMLYSAIYE